MSSTIKTGNYTLRTFNLPEVGRTFATLKVNDFGQIVGTDEVYTPVGTNAGFSSFQDNYGTFSNLTAITGLANGVNDWGTIVGTGSNRNQLAFIDTNGSFAPVSVPGALDTTANGINNLGQVVGSYNIGATTLGFIKIGNTFKTISPTGSDYTVAEAVNDLGSVVGVYRIGSMTDHGFLYSHGAFTTIDAPGVFYIQPSGINDFGTIVGYYIRNENGLAVDHGFVDTHGTLTPFDVPDATGTQLTGINNLGMIVGHYTDSTGDHGFVGQPTGALHNLV